jgi:hypothetical protein
MHSFIQRLAAAFSVIVLAAVLVSCGGSGGGADTSSTRNTGSVGILLTDGPTAEFDVINITLREIRLLSDTGSVIIFSGSKTIDLLKMRSHSELFALTTDVASGEFEKIRLLVDKIELIKLDADGNVYESHDVKLSGHGKIDLNPRGPFYITAGETLLIQIDIDAEKSLKIHESGNGKWHFRPVIFVDVIGDRQDNRLVRLSGEANDVDPAEGTLELCGTRVNSGWDGCIDVDATQSSIFGTNGELMLSNIVKGDALTVIGFLRPEDGSPSIARHDDDDDDYDDHEHDDDYDQHNLMMEAVVIEVGPPGSFVSLNGSARSAPTEASPTFDFKIDVGQGFVEDQQIGVQLLDGTRIFSRKGEELDFNAIAVDTEATVDGVLMLSNTAPDALNAALVVLDVSATTQLTGDIGALEATTLTLITAGGDRCVAFDDDTDVFQITLLDDGTLATRVTVADLESGQKIDVFGAEGTDGCFVAQSIIVVVDHSSS